MSSDATSATATGNGLGGDAAVEGTAKDLIGGIGRERGQIRGWFTRLVRAYVRQRIATARHTTVAAGRETERAQEVIRRACIKSSVTGASAGLLSTGATILTAENPAAGIFVGIPAAALAIGGEMLYRSIVHVEMTLDIADIFGVQFRPEDPSDFWRLYALAFRAEPEAHDEEGEDPGKEVVSKVAEFEEHEIEELGEKIGGQLVGESVLRNVIPVVGVAASAWTNWKLTKRVGDTVRRYCRYQRAIGDALAADEKACHAELPLLTEGFWFLFSADGNLNNEEIAVLADFMSRFDEVDRGVVRARFIDDETSWIERLLGIPEAHRDAFLHALEVAAAVDKSVSLPEQKILSRAAHALGRHFDVRRVEEMIRQFERTGVLAAH